MALQAVATTNHNGATATMWLDVVSGQVVGGRVTNDIGREVDVVLLSPTGTSLLSGTLSDVLTAFTIPKARRFALTAEFVCRMTVRPN